LRSESAAALISVVSSTGSTYVSRMARYPV
jgi:hypothetical protein